jgi:hypothetical protein
VVASEQPHLQSWQAEESFSGEEPLDHGGVFWHVDALELLHWRNGTMTSSRKIRDLARTLTGAALLWYKQFLEQASAAVTGSYEATLLAFLVRFSTRESISDLGQAFNQLRIEEGESVLSFVDKLRHWAAWVSASEDEVGARFKFASGYGRDPSAGVNGPQVRVGNGSLLG